MSQAQCENVMSPTLACLEAEVQCLQLLPIVWRPRAECPLRHSQRGFQARGQTRRWRQTDGVACHMENYVTEWATPFAATSAEQR
eukprot:9372323-Pyramimonas_sp.AAC.1